MFLLSHYFISIQYVGTVGCISGKPFFCWNRLAGVDRSQIVNVYVAYSKGLRDSV